VKRSLAGAPPLSQRVRGRLRRTSRHIKTASGRNVPTPAPAGPDERMGWMPLMRHEPHWGGMRAFALPSFYDGRVRLNVEGRESQGMVRREDYAAVLDEIETVLRDCREPITGEPVVAHIDRPFGDPMDVGPWDVDLVVHWAGMPLGLVHQDLGRIGPFPPRRTGGHASPVGACYVHGPGIPAVDLGTRNSFDVLPTVFDLAECESPWPLSGAPLKVPTVT
jgi:predicted AlkP superfamily phosphohydrolase/phosphomutase